jgi:hypothetical protein
MRLRYLSEHDEESSYGYFYKRFHNEIGPVGEEARGVTYWWLVDRPIVVTKE